MTRPVSFGTCARLPVNLACHVVAWRLLGCRSSRWHWTSFPFDLRGSVLWSRAMHAWYVYDDWDSFHAMSGVDFPPHWPALREGDVAIDCGAHVGRYAIPWSRVVGPTGRIIAFEPHPRTHDTLRRNLALNDIVNVTTIRAACWSATGELELRDVPGHSYSTTIASEAGGLMRVRVETLDRLVERERLRRVDWVKLDIEGAEVETLKGAHGVLSRFRPTLLIETHDTEEQVLSLLTAYGYRVAERIAEAGSASKARLLASAEP